jgi:UMF1 family MFS transporter
MNKKHVFVWSLYDFANSLVFITFLLYFSKWLVVNRGLADWWYNATYILGSIGLIIFAPWLGSKADVFKKERYYLILSTIGCFIFYSLAIITAISNTNIFWPAVCFGLGNFFYQLSFVFYNPLLNNISRADNQGKVSGLGFLANYIGQIVGILIALPIVAGTISFGVDPLIATLIPATILFILLSLPLLLTKSIYQREVSDSQSIERPGYLTLFKMIIVIPGVLLFLLSFFLFGDAVNTIISNFSIFTSKIFDATDSQISILTLLIIVTASIGAVGWGWLSDKIGAKKTLTYNLATWIVIIPIIAWIPNYQIFFISVIVAGICIGGMWSVSRRVVIELVPKNILNFAFGWYAISERASTIIGPLVWSMVLAVAGYRWAMFSMVGFQILAVILMWQVIKKAKSVTI